MKYLFVPFAIALALKEKGFNERCLAYYTEDKDLGMLSQAGIYNNGFDVVNQNFINSTTDAGGNTILAPLYIQVADWFRDKHSIYIAVLPFREKSDISDEYGIELCWYYSIVQDDEDLPDILCNEDDLGAHGLNYATPKEAWEEAFLEALKLI